MPKASRKGFTDGVERETRERERDINKHRRSQIEFEKGEVKSQKGKRQGHREVGRYIR